MAGLSCGIIGLPNIGKSTLFNALTADHAPCSDYPFCTIEPNIGVVQLFDPRLHFLAEIAHSKNITHATMKFLDIAGLVKGASQGEGLGNQFLGHIREADAMAHVVRCFESEKIAHVMGKIDPIRDIEIVNLELVLADHQTAEKMIAPLEYRARGKKEVDLELELMKRVYAHLDQNQPVRTLELNKEEKEILRHSPFLTYKKVLYVPNMGEEDLPDMDSPLVRQVREFAEAEGNAVLPISAEIEEEITQLPKEEQEQYLESIGLHESGLQRLIKASFKLLDLITFITAEEAETRAWTIKKGTTAYEAAGKIHTDFQKGFIRAEIVTYDDMIKYKGRVGAREAGKDRFGGKDYVIQDADVIHFMHH